MRKARARPVGSGLNKDGESSSASGKARRAPLEDNTIFEVKRLIAADSRTDPQKDTSSSVQMSGTNGEPGSMPAQGYSPSQISH